MKINGSYQFASSQDELWPMLIDPTVLANILPGCESLEAVGDNEYQGILKIKVGPVQGKFNGHLSLSDIHEPDSYSIVVDGKGAPGFVKGNGRLWLQAEGDTTTLHYEGDAQVGGRLASVGQRLLDSSAKAIIRTSLEGLEAQVQAHHDKGTPTQGESAAPAPPTQTEFALGVARHLAEELFADENQEDLIRKAIIVGGVLLTLLIIFEWFTDRIAAKTARKINKK